MNDENQPRPVVYLVHRADDRVLAESLAKALEARGVDIWFDGWEILGGDNFVLKMEEGLRRAHGGIVLLTKTGIGDGSWAQEEFAALLRNVVEEKNRSPKPFLIPVVSGECPDMPQFLRTRRPMSADDVDAIASGILRRARGSARARVPEARPAAPLSGAQLEKLHGALLVAYPKVSELRRMLSFELDMNLQAVAGTGTLSDVIFELLGAAKAQGWIDRLIAGARAHNPGNEALRAAADELGRPE